eukprot:CAMPEP_0170494244 /NCGR_PEP_ID=MMETSP0208-20121228/14530_1 /TAXON_ID=197538 /ORGANISM="Strombidium inclinatum, Strain S3" /LENGTH=61 /DNA_ID=CAMNT_0010770273 /DNA_START=1475 /DNA_END=1660 /DNA_ORIENTATION=+
MGQPVAAPSQSSDLLGGAQPSAPSMNLFEGLNQGKEQPAGGDLLGGGSNFNFMSTPSAPPQ